MGTGNAGCVNGTSNARRCLESKVSKRKEKKEKHLWGRHRGVKTSKSDLDVDVLSPYTRAKGLRAEGSVEVEHFWTGSAGKRVA